MNTETNGGTYIKGAVSALLAQIMESLRLSRSVPEPETARDALEDEITARQMVIAEVQSQIAAIKSRQNELLPIHRLPVEVLSVILSAALPLKRHHKERTKLLLVCRAWTSIIDGNPSTFWTTLSAEDPPTQRDRLLRKAGQMPVTIVTGSYYADSDGGAEDFGKYIKSNNKPFHELVVREGSDWLMEAVFTDYLAAPAPHLRSLDLEAMFGWALEGEDPNSQHLWMFSGVAPSLKSIRLRGVCIPWNSAILQNLFSLTLDSPSYLGYEPPSLEQVLGILRSCPSLQSLMLRNVGFEWWSNQAQLPPLSLNRLTAINLSEDSFQRIFSLLRHIQFPKTATVELEAEASRPHDDDDEVLKETLNLLQQHLSIKSLHLSIDHELVQLSTTGLKLSILNRYRRKQSRYYTEVFSRLGSPIQTAITSLHLDLPSNRHSTAPPGALNKIIAKLTNLSVDHPHLPKSEKPRDVALEVAQTSENIEQPTWVYPNLRSLEISVGQENCPNLTAILKLVRMRKSDIELNGKQVIMAPITFIRITFQGPRPSPIQTDVLNELKSEVAEAEYVMQPETDKAQTIHDTLSDFGESIWSSSDSSDST